MKKYSKGKRQQNKEAKKQAAAASSGPGEATLRLRRRVSGRDSIVSQATAPTNIALAGDSSPVSLFK